MAFPTEQVRAVREIRQKYREEKSRLVEVYQKEKDRIVDVYQKEKDRSAESHQTALVSLSLKEKEELSKVCVAENIAVYEVTYWCYDRLAASQTLTYSRFFTSLDEAIQLKKERSTVAGPESFKLNFGSVDFHSLYEIPDDRIGWIDDGRLHRI